MKKIRMSFCFILLLINTFAYTIGNKKSNFDFAIEHLEKSQKALTSDLKIFHVRRARYFLDRTGFSKTHEKWEYKRKALIAISNAMKYSKNKKDFKKAVLELNIAIKYVKKIKEKPNIFKQLMSLNYQLSKAQKTKKMHIKLRLLREAKEYCQGFTHNLKGNKKHLIRLIHSAYEIFRSSGSPRTIRGINEINKAKNLIKRLYARL